MQQIQFEQRTYLMRGDMVHVGSLNLVALGNASVIVHEDGTMDTDGAMREATPEEVGGPRAWKY